MLRTTHNESKSRKRDRAQMAQSDSNDTYEQAQFETRRTQLRTTRRTTMTHTTTLSAIPTTNGEPYVSTTLDMLPGEIWAIILCYAGTQSHAALCCTAKGVATRIVHRNVTEIDVMWGYKITQMTRYHRLSKISIQQPSTMTIMCDLSGLAASHLSTTLTSIHVPMMINPVPQLPNLRSLTCYSVQLDHLIAANLAYLEILKVTHTLSLSSTTQYTNTDWRMPRLHILHAPSLVLDRVRIPPTVAQLHVKQLCTDSWHNVTILPSVQVLQLWHFTNTDALPTRFPNLIALFVMTHYCPTEQGPLPMTLRVLKCGTLYLRNDAVLPPLEGLILTYIPSIPNRTHFEHIQFMFCKNAIITDLVPLANAMPRIQYLGVACVQYEHPTPQSWKDTLKAVYVDCDVRRCITPGDLPLMPWRAKHATLCDMIRKICHIDMQ